MTPRAMLNYQIRHHAIFNDFAPLTTLFNHIGVQEVAGSNPAVPIRLTSFWFFRSIVLR